MLENNTINILFIADPNSIHDIKWINNICKDDHINGYIIARKKHLLTDLYDRSGIMNAELIGSIHDFSIVRFIRTFKSVFFLKSLIKKRNINVLHILYAEPNSLWSFFRSYLNIPIIITCRGTDVLKTIPEAFQKKTLINHLVAPLYRRAFLNADWITGTSQTQIEAIRKFSERQIGLSLIRTGIDFKQIEADNSGIISTKITKPYILLPRYIKPIYNHEFCLDTLSMLPEDIKEKYQVVLVGRNSGDLQYQEKLELRIKSLEEMEFVFIEKQSQRDIIELYRKSSLVLMTPFSDGSPVSAMEAMSVGAQVILGPLDYDQDLFSSNVSILKSWNKSDFAKLICDKLMDTPRDKRLHQQLRDALDIEKNMELVKILYYNLRDSIN